MIRPQDFQTQINYDETGFLVVVIHEPTGLKRQQHFTYEEYAYRIEDQLAKQLEHELCDFHEYRRIDLKDFILNVGRCVIDGKVGTFWAVTHKPTNKRCTRNSVEHPISKTISQDLMNELIAELFKENAF